MSELVLDPSREPHLYYRIDTFVVPDEARDELEATMRRNMDFIRTLPGFRGHLVFEKGEGSSTFNLVTVAVWESRMALERAGEEVRAYYARIGFDMPRTLERWRVTMMRADCEAPPRLQ